MKPKFIDRSSDQNESFSVSHVEARNFFKVWHYHSELELVVILESEGTQFVGDSVAKFEKGDVLLLGKNLPHLLLNSPEYFKNDSDLTTKAIVINFDHDFLGKPFISLPEITPISRLLERAKRGVKFSGNSKEIAVDAISELLNRKGFDRVLELIGILGQLAETTEYSLLASQQFSESLNTIEKTRIGEVYAYVMNHFDKNPSLQEAARTVHMNPKSFSRYFKKTTKKNFTKYVNEVRINYARKLLIEKKLNVSEIGYEVGFNSISNFNRQFKNILGVSPKAYVRSHTE